LNKAKLKELRDEVEKAGIGVYLEVMKQLFAAIDEHVNEDETQTVNELQAKITALEAEVAKLQAENATLTTVTKEAVAQTSVTTQIK
jgi:uncharacterized small protein (DUF1192 family)